jgi:hypothetical protein
MKSWHSRIVNGPDDLSPVFEAIAYFDAEYQEARDEMKDLRGQRLIEVQARFPGIIAYRYEQMAELDSIIAFLEIREEATVGEKRRFYVEHYNRKLTDQMVNKFAESHPEVIALKEIRNRVVAVRNRFFALSKAHDAMQYRFSSISDLWCAGMTDAIL